MKAFDGGRYALIVLALVLVGSVAGRCDGTRLVAGDVISVVVGEEKDITRNYQIDKDGAVTLPTVGAIKLAGMSSTEAAAKITMALAKVLVSPQVTVAFVERARMQVFVVGQVRKPGPTEVGAGDTVIQALAQAGYDETADLSRVTVRRDDTPIATDLSKYLSADDISTNIELHSGDTIVVPRLDSIGTVLVLGQVVKAGALPISRDMTFREMMGLIGGVRVEADTDKITIKRAGIPDPIRVDYKPAMDGDPVADIVLMQGDTIYVPEIETAFFTVMGGVTRPGQFPLKGKLTLREAVGVAGGQIPNIGDIRKVQVARSSDGIKPADTVTIDLTKVIAGIEPDPIVKRGDVIYVAVARQKQSFLSVLTSLLPFGWLLR